MLTYLLWKYSDPKDHDLTGFVSIYTMAVDFFIILAIVLWIIE